MDASIQNNTFYHNCYFDQSHFTNVELANIICDRKNLNFYNVIRILNEIRNIADQERLFTPKQKYVVTEMYIDLF